MRSMALAEAHVQRNNYLQASTSNFTQEGKCIRWVRTQVSQFCFVKTLHTLKICIFFPLLYYWKCDPLPV